MSEAAADVGVPGSPRQACWESHWVQVKNHLSLRVRSEGTCQKYAQAEQQMVLILRSLHLSILFSSSLSVQFIKISLHSTRIYIL